MMKILLFVLFGLFVAKSQKIKSIDALDYTKQKEQHIEKKQEIDYYNKNKFGYPFLFVIPSIAVGERINIEGDNPEPNFEFMYNFFYEYVLDVSHKIRANAGLGLLFESWDTRGLVEIGVNYVYGIKYSISIGASMRKEIDQHNYPGGISNFVYYTYYLFDIGFIYSFSNTYFFSSGNEIGLFIRGSDEYLGLRLNYYNIALF